MSCVEGEAAGTAFSKMVSVARVEKVKRAMAGWAGNVKGDRIDLGAYSKRLLVLQANQLEDFLLLCIQKLA